MKPEVKHILQNIENELSKELDSINIEFIENQLVMLRPEFFKQPTIDFFCHKMQDISQIYSEEKINVLTNILAAKWKNELLHLLDFKKSTPDFTSFQLSIIQRIIGEIDSLQVLNP